MHQTQLVQGTTENSLNVIEICIIGQHFLI